MPRLLAAALCALLACALPAAAAPGVAAASDLKFALDEIARAWSAGTGKSVRLTYGSSGNFRRQIAEGAPFEVFLSADESYVLALAKEGRLVDDGALYAIGRLALFAPAGSPVDPDQGLAGVAALARAGRIGKFAIANPAHAPYGRAAREALESAGAWKLLEARLVLGENVSQAAQFATSGNAAAGLVAYSLMFTPAVSGRGRFALVPGLGPRAAAPADGAGEGRGRGRARLLPLLAGPGGAGGILALRLHPPGPLMDWTALTLSIELAAWTMAVLLPVGIALGRLLAWRQFAWKPLAEGILALPLVLPPTVLGFYLLVGLGAASPVGQWYQSAFGRPLVFSFEGLLVASVVFNLPFAIQPMQRAFESIPRDVRDAAACCGLTPWQALVRIELPLAWPGILSGMVMTFAHTLGEFGVVLMVGGSIPGETRTVAIAIYDSVQSFDNAAAGVMSAVLLGLSLVAMAMVYATSARRTRGRG